MPVDKLECGSEALAVGAEAAELEPRASNGCRLSGGPVGVGSVGAASLDGRVSLLPSCCALSSLACMSSWTSGEVIDLEVSVL